MNTSMNQLDRFFRSRCTQHPPMAWIWWGCLVALFCPVAILAEGHRAGRAMDFAELNASIDSEPVDTSFPSPVTVLLDVKASVKESKQRFERVPFDEPSPANWEVSARVLPWMIESYWSYDRLVSVQERIGQSARLFTHPDGPPLRLYDQEGAPGYNYNTDHEFGLLMSGIEVARRTPTGFRFSLGALYSQEGVELNRPAESLIQQLEPNEYLLIRNEGSWRAFWLSMGVQYTINRRRRFRINVGLQAIGQLAETYSRKEYLVGGEPRETLFVSQVTTRNRGLFSWFLPLPQLTFEYRLRQNLALSFGVGGMSGVGATYGW